MSMSPRSMTASPSRCCSNSRISGSPRRAKGRSSFATMGSTSAADVRSTPMEACFPSRTPWPRTTSSKRYGNSAVHGARVRSKALRWPSWRASAFPSTPRCSSPSTADLLTGPNPGQHVATHTEDLLAEVFRRDSGKGYPKVDRGRTGAGPAIHDASDQVPGRPAQQRSGKAGLLPHRVVSGCAQVGRSTLDGSLRGDTEPHALDPDDRTRPTLLAVVLGQRTQAIRILVPREHDSQTEASRPANAGPTV